MYVLRKKVIMKRVIYLLSILTLIACSNDNSNSKSSQSLNFTDIYTIEADTLDIDMISSTAENSLYLTYSADNGYNENILKLNVSTNNVIEMVYPDLAEARQIEIVNNNIFSFSSNDIMKLDLNLNLISTNNSITEAYYPRIISRNNTLQIIKGISNILVYDVTSDNYTFPPFTTNPNYFLKADGEIINDVLYTFGGLDLVGQNWIPSSQINIYNYTTSNWSSQNLPFNVSESFTDVYNNEIIVSGNKQLNYGDAFIGTYNPTTGIYADLATSLNLSNISIRGVTILNNEIYVAYADFATPFPNLIDIKIAKATLP
jgi:hypothetical protein